MARPPLRNGNGELRAVLDALERQGESLTHVAATLQQQGLKFPSAAQALAPWAAILITVGSLIAGGSYFISQRPTVPDVQTLVEKGQKPIVDAMQEQKAALSAVAQENKAAIKEVSENLKGVGEDLRKVRESQIREETIRTLARPGERPSRSDAD